MIQVINSSGTLQGLATVFIFDANGKLKFASGGGGGGGGTVTSIATTGPITGGTITTYGTIGIDQATTTTDGYLSSTDWNTFNNKFDTPTGTTSQYVRGDGSLATLPTSGGIPHTTASGTDTYTATVSGVTSYADGDAYLVRFTNGNTTIATLNINGIGAVNLYRNNDGPLVPGDILDGAEMLCVYNSSTPSFQCIGTSPNTLLSYVTNDDTVTITKGQPVYASGGVGDRLKVKLAYNTGDATSAQTIGLVFSTSIAAGQKGIIIMQGLLTGLSILPTSTWADSDPVYLGPTAGTIAPTKQYAPNHLVYLGFVTTASNGSAGRLYVRVQNGYEMDELHNVQARTPSLNDTLYYDNAVSPAQWKTASIASILGYTPQQQLSLTTSGSSGPATLVGSTLNIPNYGGGGVSVVSKSVATYTSVGTGSQTLASVLIPAGTFTTGDTIQVRTRFRRNANGTATQAHIHINTANNLTGAVVWKSSIVAATTRWVQFYGHGIIKNATTDTELFATNTNIGNDDGANTFDGRNVAIDWTVNQYFLFSLFSITAPDVFLLSYFEIIKR